MYFPALCCPLLRLVFPRPAPPAAAPAAARPTSYSLARQPSCWAPMPSCNRLVHAIKPSVQQQARWGEARHISSSGTATWPPSPTHPFTTCSVCDRTSALPHIHRHWKPAPARRHVFHCSTVHCARRDQAAGGTLPGQDDSGAQGGVWLVLAWLLAWRDPQPPHATHLA